MRVGDCNTVAMVHSNKRTTLRALAVMASVSINHEEVYLCTDVVHGHHVYTCEITGGKKRGNEFCFSLVQFTNCDVSSLLALLKAIIICKFL